METEVKWYRVIDPLSPLCGCDVRGWKKPIGNDRMSTQDFMVIEAMRRIDIFVGDRPFQLVAPAGEALGLLIDWTQLETSPLQDDIVELATDIPYGKFLEEIEVSRDNDCSILHIVTYERMFQVALLVPNDDEESPLMRSVVVSRVIDCKPNKILDISDSFESGASVVSVRRMIEAA